MDRADAPSWRFPFLVLALVVPGAIPSVLGGAIPTQAAAPGGWRALSPAVTPPAMAGGMMAYDNRAGVFLLFGGWNGTDLGQTWLLDPGAETWTRVDAPTAPHPRGDGMLVYDPGADAFILFGGWYEEPGPSADNPTYHRLGDTWAFNLANGTWWERHPARSPSPRSDAAVANDPREGVTLLVGGFDGSTYLGDVWYYNYSADAWTPRSSLNPPSPRADGRMAYDAAQGRFYLFGGNDFSGPHFTFHHLDDTWTYDWATDAWSTVNMEVSPPARDYAILAWDASSDVVLLFGGFGNNTILGDLWVLNPRLPRWSDISFPGGPPGRYAGVGGFATREGFLVVVGGLTADGLRADAWSLRYPPPLTTVILASGGDVAMGQTVTFAVQTVGGSGHLVQARWDFGDGASAEGGVVGHAYRRPGVFTATFRGVDEAGQTTTAVYTVTVGVLAPLWVDATALALAVLVGALVLRRIRRRPRRHVLALLLHPRRWRRAAPGLEEKPGTPSPGGGSRG